MTSTLHTHTRTGTGRARLALFLAALFLAACGSDPAPSVPGVSPGSSPSLAATPSFSVSSPPASTPAPSGPTASPFPSASPAAMLPAGVQYPDPATPAIWGLPNSSKWAVDDPRSRVAQDGQVVAVLGLHGKQIRLAVRDASGTWADRLVDRGVGVRGPGAYRTTDWILPTGLAASPAGYLVFGQESIADAGHHILSRLGFVWFSRDGRAWTRTDLRGALGSGAAFVPTSAMATGNGWLLVGSLSTRNLRGKAVVVALSSTDGVHWRQASKISSSWATTGDSLDTLGDKTVLSGFEWICERNGYMLNAAIGNPVLRLWSSSDGGATWQDGDSSGGGLVKPNAPAPDKASSCSGGIGTYATTGAYLGVINGRAVAVSADHARIATSTNLVDWQAADLPGAVPPGGPGYQPGAASSLLVSPDGQGLAMLSLESRRDDTGAIAGFGSQVLAWRSADGITWGPQLAGPPLQVTAKARLLPSPDGAVYLSDQPETLSTCGRRGCTYTLGAVGYQRSVAGPTLPAAGCVPAPAADCAFATLEGSLAGADLSGINLFGARIAGTADLSGANLSGARLNGLNVESGANLSGANLSGADLSNARIRDGVLFAQANFSKAGLKRAQISSADGAGASFAGADLSETVLSSLDLSTVTLAGATMAGTYVNQTVFAARLTGVHLSGPLVKIAAAEAGLPDNDFGKVNLAGWFFSGQGPSSIGNLRGADFRRAGVAGLVFTNVDLTGARFPKGARSLTDFSSGGLKVNFLSGVTCPDGKQATKVGAFYDCRIGG